MMGSHYTSYGSVDPEGGGGAGGSSPEKHRNQDPIARVRTSKGDSVDRLPDVEELTPFRFRRASGSLAERFDVDGENLSGEEYQNIIYEGKTPGGDEARPRTYKNHNAYVDFVLSAPKSVGMAVYDDSLPQKLRMKIVAAHQDAVDRAEEEIHDKLQANLGQGQVGECDAMTIKYDESIASPQEGRSDPLLHSHLTTPNFGYCPEVDGYRSLDTTQVEQSKEYIDEVYKETLRNNLEKIGLETEAAVKRNSIQFELKGYDEWQIEAFSNRGQKILENKAANVETDFEAWLSGRDSYYKSIDPDEEYANITKRLREVGGFDDEQKTDWDRLSRDKLSSGDTRFSRLAQHYEEENREKNPGTAMEYALERLTDEEKVFDKTDVAKYYMRERRRRGMESLEKSEIDAHIKKAYESNYLLKIESTDKFDRIYFSTPEIAEKEREIQEAAEQTRDGDSLIPQDIGAKLNRLNEKNLKEKFGVTPSENQKEALGGISKKNRRLVPLQASAGAGKTTMMSVLNEFVDDETEIQGLAPSSQAVRELEDSSGISSTTLYQYLQKEGERVNDRESQVIVLDEASMSHTKELSSLVEISERFDDQLILVGDARQLQTPGAGGDFEQLIERQYGVECTDNWRQNPKLWDSPDKKDKARAQRDIAESIRNDPSGKGIAALEKYDCLKEYSDKKELGKQVISNYDPEKSQLITSTHETRRWLNSVARQIHIETGEVDLRDHNSRDEDYKPPVEFPTESESRESIQIARGDLITFRDKKRRRASLSGKQVTVGKKQPYRVVDVDKDKIEILVNEEIVRMNPQENEMNIEYGYAQTTHQAQGSTSIESIYVHDGSPIEASDFYVGCSRQQLSLEVFTPSRDLLAEQIKEEEPQTSLDKISDEELEEAAPELVKALSVDELDDLDSDEIEKINRRIEEVSSDLSEEEIKTIVQGKASRIASSVFSIIRKGVQKINLKPGDGGEKEVEEDEEDEKLKIELDEVENAARDESKKSEIFYWMSKNESKTTYPIFADLSRDQSRLDGDPAVVKKVEVESEGKEMWIGKIARGEKDEYVQSLNGIVVERASFSVKTENYIDEEFQILHGARRKEKSKEQETTATTTEEESEEDYDYGMGMGY
ncbi:MAG: AAA family ATPase [Candidatus Paceibacteria bacterium]